MEDSLRTRVIGQDHVLAAVSDAVRISRANLQNPTRPVASFLFLGPTGVGKVRTALLYLCMSPRDFVVTLVFCRLNSAKHSLDSFLAMNNEDCEFSGPMINLSPNCKQLAWQLT